MSVASVTNMRYACNSNQACQSKTNLATQAYWAKPTKPNPPIQTKLLGKAVDAWVRSAFGNVFLSWSRSPRHDRGGMMIMINVVMVRRGFKCIFFEIFFNVVTLHMYLPRNFHSILEYWYFSGTSSLAVHNVCQHLQVINSNTECSQKHIFIQGGFF